MSKKLTAKRLEEIKALPVVFDNDIPEFTDDQLKAFKPANEFYRISPKKKRVSINIDLEVLEVLKSQGKGYQTRINQILREAVLPH